MARTGTELLPLSLAAKVEYLLRRMMPATSSQMYKVGRQTVGVLSRTCQGDCRSRFLYPSQDLAMQRES